MLSAFGHAVMLRSPDSIMYAKPAPSPLAKFDATTTADAADSDAGGAPHGHQRAKRTDKRSAPRKQLA